ncbi:MAG: BlaI/MecI/CopY family transcriptional regulator, partial [Candidatus Zixiibacteriota bacterium]
DDRPAYTTVMTLLGRLAQKGLLKKNKEDRTCYYTPAVDRRTFLESRIEKVKACLKRNFNSGP